MKRLISQSILLGTLTGSFPGISFAETLLPPAGYWFACTGVSRQPSFALFLNLMQQDTSGVMWRVIVNHYDSATGHSHSLEKLVGTRSNVTTPNQLRINFNTGYLEAPEALIAPTTEPLVSKGTYRSTQGETVSVECYPNGIRPRGGVTN